MSSESTFGHDDTYLVLLKCPIATH